MRLFDACKELNALVTLRFLINKIKKCLCCVCNYIDDVDVLYLYINKCLTNLRL